MEASFLDKTGAHPTFSLAFARQILGHTKQDPTPQFLEQLQSKGWIRCIRRQRKCTALPIYKTFASIRPKKTIPSFGFSRDWSIRG
ncbi:MAG: hypothetical protein A2V87_11280 [Deltaproteobacteria bacterium RBG_16_58_17]|nr:MAG: hypothetical protein A2V87_11280 [Deltaproteobacteria bacterium RBG_16_58_17]OHE16841.1 MAG: hypothetical protein A2X96_03730 [Syntrophobacterales bacterium GWC2_56_13]